MKLKIIAIGTKMPKWIVDGFHEYQKRMSKECALKLTEIAMLKRGKNKAVEQLKQKESKKLLAKVNEKDFVIALDEHGKTFSTKELSQQLNTWLNLGRNISFLIGGPDGLSKNCLNRANLIWSLSSLTFPHSFVRIILAEQLYRALSILKNHPYHRE